MEAHGKHQNNKGFIITGIYLFGKDKDGKHHAPIEIEHLTIAERRDALGTRTPEELLNWIDALCKNIIQIENFLYSEGYERHEEEEEEGDDLT